MLLVKNVYKNIHYVIKDIRSKGFNPTDLVIIKNLNDI